MKKRSLIAVAVLSIVTFGIYCLIWAILTSKELQRSGSPKIPPVWIWLAPILAPLLPLVLLAPLPFMTGSASSVLTVGLTMLVSLCVFAAIGLFLFWMYRYAEAAAVVLRNSQTRDFIFWVGLAMFLVGVPFVWVLIMQSEYNKLTGANPQATHAS